MQEAEREKIGGREEGAGENVQARAKGRAGRPRIAVAEEAGKAAADGKGMPIEVGGGSNKPDKTRREYLRTVVAYNESQFRLQRSLGWPVR